MTMSEATDVAAVEDLARRAQPVDVEEGYLGAGYGEIPTLAVVRRRNDESVDVLNFERFAAHPPRAVGHAEFYDHVTFAEYVQARADAATTLWALETDRTVTAVFNDHTADAAGWRDHQATLTLQLDDTWVEWRTGGQGSSYRGAGYPKQVMLPHKDFAEFLEDHAADIYKPDGDRKLPNANTMLGIARNFQVKTNSHTRLTRAVRTDSDTVSIHYEPREEARGGQKGDIEIPAEFWIRVPIFRRGPLITVRALFRWHEDRNSGDLTLGYKLVRPDDEQRAAFDASLVEVRNILEGRAPGDSEGDVANGVLPAVINYGEAPRPSSVNQEVQRGRARGNDYEPF